jgi:hypothetical protein
MPFCSNCDKRPTCKEICLELEKILPKAQTGRMKGEFMLNQPILEAINQKEKDKRSGWQNKPQIYDDNWEG